jgi:hypothetical protein
MSGLPARCCEEVLLLCQSPVDNYIQCETGGVNKHIMKKAGRLSRTAKHHGLGPPRYWDITMLAQWTIGTQIIYCTRHVTEIQEEQLESSEPAIELLSGDCYRLDREQVAQTPSMPGKEQD